MLAFIRSSETSKTVSELHTQCHSTSGDRGQNSGYFWVEEDVN